MIFEIPLQKAEQLLSYSHKISKNALKIEQQFNTVQKILLKQQRSFMKLYELLTINNQQLLFNKVILIISSNQRVTKDSLMDKELTPHFPTAKIKKMIQMNQDIGKLSNSIPHLLQHSLQIFLNDILGEVDKIAIQEDSNKLTPTLIKTALKNLKKYKFLEATVNQIQDEEPPKRRKPQGDHEGKKQSKPRKKKKAIPTQEHQSHQQEQFGVRDDE